MKNNRTTLRFNNYLFTLLFLTVMGTLAALSYHYSTTFDLTRGSRNSLTEPTQALLQSLQQPLKFIAYVPDEAELHLQLRELVAKYQKYNKQVTLEIINPDLDPARAQADGIENQRQVVLKLGQQAEVLGSVNEQSVVNAIQRLQRQDKRLVIFLEGHKEAELFDDSSAGLSQLAIELKRKGFKLQPHSLLSTGSLPNNTHFVVLVAPKQAYLPEEVRILENYLEQGGNLLWLNEPNQKTGLETLQKALTLSIPQGRLLSIDDKPLISINSPNIIPITRYGEATLMQQQKGQTLFSYATIVQRDLSLKPVWDFDEILKSSDKVWFETNSNAVSKNIQYDKNTEDIAGPINLGIVLTKEIKAITNKETKQQRVVVIGDSSFMRNGFIGFGGNLELTERLFNWLAANEHLLVLPVKIAPDTSIEMKNWQLYSIGIFFLFVLPLALLLFGILRWAMRKKA